MECNELSAREEFTYSHMPTLERGGGTLGRRAERGAEKRSDRGERYRPERDSYTVDVRASDLQLAQPETLKHPCFSYRAWLYSVLIGVRQEIVRKGYTGGTYCITYVLTYVLTTAPPCRLNNRLHDAPCLAFKDTIFNFLKHSALPCYLACLQQAAVCPLAHHFQQREQI